jgi:hypothetical protein
MAWLLVVYIMFLLQIVVVDGFTGRLHKKKLENAATDPSYKMRGSDGHQEDSQAHCNAADKDMNIVFSTGCNAFQVNLCPPGVIVQ